MSLSLGIVGLPNVGKSTLFNALVKSAQAAASNYPFCTIEPNVGMVAVPDPRLEQLAAVIHPQQIIPATVEFVDIAGIIRGASKGEGLGNQFLGHIKQSAAIVLVARFFEDPNVIHVEGTINPASDLETVLIELILADMATLERALDRYRKNARAGAAEAKEQLAYAEKIAAALEQELPARSVVASTPHEQLVLQELQLLTAKPVIIVANVSEEEVGVRAEKLFSDYALSRFVSGPELVVPICAKIESELAQLADEDLAEMMGAYGMQEPGLHRLIRSSYKLLNLSTYFTAGEKEVRAWTISTGSTAPVAAGVIHTDFTKAFIRAETIAFSDYISGNGEQGAKEAGKLRLEGKEYVVQDGDVLHFRVGV